MGARVQQLSPAILSAGYSDLFHSAVISPVAMGRRDRTSNKLPLPGMSATNLSAGIRFRSEYKTHICLSYSTSDVLDSVGVAGGKESKRESISAMVIKVTSRTELGEYFRIWTCSGSCIQRRW